MLVFVAYSNNMRSISISSLGVTQLFFCEYSLRLTSFAVVGTVCQPPSNVEIGDSGLMQKHIEMATWNAMPLEKTARASYDAPINCSGRYDRLDQLSLVGYLPA